MLTTIVELIIGVPLAYLAFMHLCGPILVKRSERLPHRYQFTILDEREFFSHRSETFIMLDYEMRNLGFHYVGSSILSNTNTDSLFSLYTKTDEVMSAMLTTIESPLGDFTYAEFSRLYADGSTLDVNNAPIPSLFPRNPMRLQLRYPHINTLAGLYAVTQKLLASHHNGAEPLALRAGEEFHQVEALLNGELERLVKGGYYSADQASGYRPITLKGALLFSWKSLWPWQPIRQHLDLLRARRRLQQARG